MAVNHSMVMTMKDCTDYSMVGRVRQMEKFMVEWKKGKIRVFVVHGPKLVGKSTFVKHFIDSQCDTITVILFDFNKIDNFEEFEYELFNNNHLDVGHTSECRRDLKEATRCSKCARNLRGKIRKFGQQRLVFVFDNIQSMCDDGKERQRLEERTYDLIMRLYMLDIVYDNPNVSLIVVSTMRHAFARWNVHYVELQELDLESSLILLCNVAGNDKCTDRTIVTKIAKLCDGLPLAVINAGLLFHDDTLTSEDILAVLCALKIQSLSGEMLPSIDKIDFNFWNAFTGLNVKNKEHLLKLAKIVGVSKSDVEGIGDIFDYKQDLSLFKWQVLCPLRNRNLIKYNQASGSVDLANDLLATFLGDIKDAIDSLPEGNVIQKKIVELVDKLDEANCRRADGEENEDSDSGKYNRGKDNSSSGYNSAIVDGLSDLSIESNDRVPLHSMASSENKNDNLRGMSFQSGHISHTDKRQRYQDNNGEHTSTDDNNIYVDENLNNSGSTSVNKDRKQREAEEKKFNSVADLAKGQNDDIVVICKSDRHTMAREYSGTTNDALTQTDHTSQLIAIENVSQVNDTKQKEISNSSCLHGGLNQIYESEPRRLDIRKTSDHTYPSMPTNFGGASTRNDSSHAEFRMPSLSIEGEDTYLGDHLSGQNIGATQPSVASCDGVSRNEKKMSFSLEGEDTFFGENLSRMPIGATENVSSVSMEMSKDRMQATNNLLPENSVQNDLDCSCTARREQCLQTNNSQNRVYGTPDNSRRHITQSCCNDSMDKTQEGTLGIENNGLYQQKSWGATKSHISLSSAPSLNVASFHCLSSKETTV